MTEEQVEHVNSLMESADTIMDLKMQIARLEGQLAGVERANMMFEIMLGYLTRILEGRSVEPPEPPEPPFTNYEK